MLMSLGVVFFGMQLMMVGPLKGRLDKIQTRMDVSDNSMNKLVSARDSVFRTNDLLTGLEDQASRLQALEKSIADIQTLRNTIQQEADAATVALAGLDRMASVQERIINSQQQTQQAANQLTAIQDLQKAIVHGAESTEVAGNSLEGLVALQNRLIAASNGYEKASEGVANLTELTQRMIAQSDDLKVAAQKFDEFVGLKTSIQTAAADLDAAHTGIAALSTLKEEVLATTANLETAQNNARTLVALNDSLNGSSLNLSSAQQNLDALLALQENLSQQSSQVAVAIQNLEIMDDFRTEVGLHVKSLETLRRTLMDIAMMESTLGRVANVVEPLTQIGNLRRLGEEEVREAARVILDRRTTRFSQTESTTETGSAVETQNVNADDEIPVPLPPEARN